MSATALEGLTQRLQARRGLPPPDGRRALRLAAGASQADVAEVVGVTRQAVQLWEAGRRAPRGPNLEAYVAVLAVLSQLSGATGPVAPEIREAGFPASSPRADEHVDGTTA